MQKEQVFSSNKFKTMVEKKTIFISIIFGKNKFLVCLFCQQVSCLVDDIQTNH